MAELAPGDHVCLIYDDTARRDALLLEFCEAGLAEPDRVFYVADDAAPGVVGGLTDRACAGQIHVQHAHDTFLADGEFDPDRVLASFRSTRDESLAQGFKALRAAGDPPAVLATSEHARRMADYERRSNELFADGSMLAICSYDTRKADAAALLSIMDAHPIVLFAVGEHPRLRATRAAAGKLAVSGWLDVTTLGSIAGPLADEIQDGESVEVDLGGVDFVDIAGLRLFLEAGSLLDDRGLELRLVSAPEWIPDVLDLLGYLDRRGLVLQ